MELKFLALLSHCLLLGEGLAELGIRCTAQVQNQKVVDYVVTSQKCLEQQNPTNHLSRQASRDIHSLDSGLESMTSCSSTEFFLAHGIYPYFWKNSFIFMISIEFFSNSIFVAFMKPMLSWLSKLALSRKILTSSFRVHTSEWRSCKKVSRGARKRKGRKGKVKEKKERRKESKISCSLPGLGTWPVVRTRRRPEAKGSQL